MIPKKRENRKGVRQVFLLIKIESNNTVFIPANVSHEFWNNSNVPAEVIIIMFGEGA